MTVYYCKSCNRVTEETSCPICNSSDIFPVDPTLEMNSLYEDIEKLKNPQKKMTEFNKFTKDVQRFIKTKAEYPDGGVFEITVIPEFEQLVSALRDLKFEKDYKDCSPIDIIITDKTMQQTPFVLPIYHPHKCQDEKKACDTNMENALVMGKHYIDIADLYSQRKRLM